MSINKISNQLNEILKQFQEGNKKKAYLKLKNYISIYPDNLIAVYNFAYMSELLNKIDVAVKFYKTIIKKNNDHWQSRFNYYLILIKQEKYINALDLINDVLKIKKNYQPALRDKALVMYHLGKPDEGLEFINQSIKINPKDYIALNTLGLIYGALKLDEKAKEVFNLAIKINSQYFPSYNNLGNCLLRFNKIDLALQNFKKAHDINNDFQEAINNMANIYLLKSKYTEAIELYKTALKKGGNIAKIYYNIGVAYSHLRNYKVAEKYYLSSYKLNPKDDLLKKNFSILYLATGNYKKAWEYFDGRLKLSDFVFKNSNLEKIRHKLWKGGGIKSNEKILVVKEQGVGDEILYGSMYPDLLKKFPNCEIESDKRLLSIFQRSFGNKDKFVPFLTYTRNNDAIEKFDKILYAGSLGKMFRNSIAEFPKSSFLIVDKSKFKEVHLKLNKLNDSPKIGITWNSKNNRNAEDKSISLDLLYPILKIKNFAFINLQYGETKSEINNFCKINKTTINTIADIDLFNDFESISALLLNLDLLITVSNTTAHLAGALGVPTWLIKPRNHAVFHYWNQPNSNTPWYPSIRLINYIENWENTVEFIKDELEKKSFNNSKLVL